VLVALVVLGIAVLALAGAAILVAHNDSLARAKATARAENQRHTDFCYGALSDYRQRVADHWASLTPTQQVEALLGKTSSPTPWLPWLWALTSDPACMDIFPKPDPSTSP
jgi:hypothetical protein